MGVTSYKFRSNFQLLHFLANRRIGLLQAKLFSRCSVFIEFKKRIFVKHLPDFLAQLKRGQLEQANRLLQLRRERQVLRKTKR